MSNCIGDVLQFMQAAGQTVLNRNDKQAELYLKLIKEELQEFDEAMQAKDDVEIADALADTMWVMIGYMLSRGWDAYGIWNEVARSNLAKIDPATGKVLKREDGKVQKPEGWSPPDIAKVLDKGW